jgi:hypothetical protein
MILKDIKKAFSKLPPEELARLRALFESVEAERFDKKIERDAENGKLDRAADEALAEFRKGRA